MPDNTGFILTLLHVLLVHARHLSLTLDRRSTAWGFSVIAQFFGTARLPMIRARLARGILRIMALQRVLLSRAKRGIDVRYANPWTREPRPKPPAPPPSVGDSEPPPPARKRTRRCYADTTPDLDTLPSLAELEAEARRRKPGALIADICRDLGIDPSLCFAPFWNALWPVITWSGGNLLFIKDFRQRQRAFEPEMNRTPPLCTPEETRPGIERMLGFFIGDRWPRMPDPGDTPVWALAAATRPP